MMHALAWHRRFGGAAMRKLAPLCFLLAAITASLVVGASHPAQAALPGANGKLAFTSDRDGNTEIYVMNADGTGPTRLTNNPAAIMVPRLVARGENRLHQRSGRQHRDLRDERRRQRPDQPHQQHGGRHYAPWSPDGRKIAFTSERDGNPEIYVMNADGSAQTRLTNNTALDEAPDWSPDGTKIAFASNRDGNAEIYVMNADGSGQTNLTNHTTAFDIPDWSPDGAKIAFRSNRDGRSDAIYVMNAVDGDGAAMGTTYQAHIRLERRCHPAWSPDGKKIAFTSDRVGNYQIHVMDADGSDQTNLTGNSSQNYGPDWQPLWGRPEWEARIHERRDGTGDLREECRRQPPDQPHQRPGG